MPNCYLFSNCRKSDETEFLNNIKKLNLNKSDMLVFLNTGRLFYPFIQYFKEFTNNHLIMRRCGMYGLKSYFGFNLAFDHSKFFASITELNIDDTSVSINRGYKATDNAIYTAKTLEECKWLDEYRKTTAHDPTTGYASYYVLQDFFGVNEKDITLVNFYGNEDNSTGKWTDHDWNYEDGWLKSRKRIFC